MTARDHSALVGLFLRLFDDVELRGFLAGLGGEVDLRVHLPVGPVTLQHLMEQAAAVLERQGYVDSTLFGALADRFPRRRAEIVAIAAARGCSLAASPPGGPRCENIDEMTLDLRSCGPRTWGPAPLLELETVCISAPGSGVAFRAAVAGDPTDRFGPRDNVMLRLWSGGVGWAASFHVTERYWQRLSPGSPARGGVLEGCNELVFGSGIEDSGAFLAAVTGPAAPQEPLFALLSGVAVGARQLHTAGAAGRAVARFVAHGRRLCAADPRAWFALLRRPIFVQ